MDDLFKKILYTGVGLVSMTAEKLQKVVDELVSEKKITNEEGKRIVDDFFHTTETKRAEFESQIRTIADRSVQSFSFATTRQIEELRSRIEELESKQTATKTTKSTSAAKTTAKKEKEEATA